jgi:hypothetical protein
LKTRFEFQSVEYSFFNRKQLSIVESPSRPESSPKTETSKSETSNDVNEDDEDENDGDVVDEMASNVTIVSTTPTNDVTSRSNKTSALSRQQQQQQSRTATASAKLSIQLKTIVTLKSPIEGSNLGPYHKPEEFMERIVNNLTSQGF